MRFSYVRLLGHLARKLVPVVMPNWPLNIIVGQTKTLITAPSERLEVLLRTLFNSSYSEDNSKL